MSITGYLGGEKIGLFDDAKFKALAAKQGHCHRLSQGRIAGHDGYGPERHGLPVPLLARGRRIRQCEKASRPPPQSDIVFNSPIVLYTHKAVADGLVNGGLVTKDDSGAYHMDMAKAVGAMVANTTWPTSDTRQATGSSASTRPIR